MSSIDVLNTIDELIGTDSYSTLYDLELLIKLKEDTRIMEISSLITYDRLEAFVNKYFGLDKLLNDDDHFASTLAQRMELFTIISNTMLLNRSQQFTRKFHFRNLVKWATKDLIQWSGYKGGDVNDYKHLTIICRVLFLASLSERKIVTETLRARLNAGSEALLELLRFFALKLKDDPIFLLDGGCANGNDIFVQLSLIEVLKVTFNILCNFTDLVLDTLKRLIHSVIEILATLDNVKFEYSNQLKQQLQHIFVCLPIELIAGLRDFDVFVISLFRYIDCNLLTESSFKMSTSSNSRLDEIDLEISSKLSILTKALNHRFSGDDGTDRFTKSGDSSSTDVLSLVGSFILPSKEDRKEALGLVDLASAKTLSSKLLRLLVDPFFPRSKDVMYDLYWIISGRVTENFIKNIGFGLASGFLVKNNIGFSERWEQLSETSKSAGSGSDKINPVTGAEESDKSLRDSLSSMTDEEKEREAERLFVLFERIKINGVLNLENPIAKAVREGKFQELD